MIRDGEAGVHCGACGYEVRVTTPAEAGALETRLLWRDAHPLCPECGEPATFEDYLGDADDLDRPHDSNEAG